VGGMVVMDLRNVYKEFRCWFIMKGKKFLVIGLLGLFMINFIGLAMAADLSQEAAEAAEASVTFASGFFGTLLAPLFGETEMLSRVFFALLLGMIIYSIISVMFKDSSRVIQWGVTGAITALALLGLPANFLEVVRTQYGAMGATILTIIPFIIILVFSLRTRSVLLARMTWIFYSMYYLVMYAYKITTTLDSGETLWIATETIPYLAAFLVGIGIFFFIGALRNLIFKGEIKGIQEHAEKGIEKAKLLKSLKNKELKDVYSKGDEEE